MVRVKITHAARSRRFYDFCIMRLRGQSDTTYRQYDLLEDNKYHLLDRPFEYMAKYAGRYWSEVTQEYGVLSQLQRDFQDIGFGIIPTPQIKKLVREYYIYGKIRYENMRWTMRDPDEALMLYNQHMATLKLMQATD